MVLAFPCYPNPRWCWPFHASLTQTPKRPGRPGYVRGQSVLLEGGGTLVAEFAVDGDTVAAHAVDVVVQGQLGRGGVGHVDEAAEFAGEGLGLEADVHVVLQALRSSLLHDVACSSKKGFKAKGTVESGHNSQSRRKL